MADGAAWDLEDEVLVESDAVGAIVAAKLVVMIPEG